MARETKETRETEETKNSNRLVKIAFLIKPSGCVVKESGIFYDKFNNCFVRMKKNFVVQVFPGFIYSAGIAASNGEVFAIYKDSKDFVLNDCGKMVRLRIG